MKTIELELKLMSHFNWLSNTIVPAVSERSGLVRFETDMIILNTSNYATGVEIKISLSDLKADSKKKQWRETQLMSEEERVDFFFKRFKYFYYAVPENLVEKTLELIPEWVGVLRVSDGGVTKARWASVLSKEKWSEKDKVHLNRLGCKSIFNLKKNILI